MNRLLRKALTSLVRRGRLRVTTASGATFEVGDGTGTAIAVRFTTAAAERSLLVDPELKVGEAYMDGGLVIEEGSIADLLDLVMPQMPRTGTLKWAMPFWWARYVIRRLQQFNPMARSRRNVAHHYDLNGQLYSLFLDDDRQYSCAYFENAEQSLDDAQLAKKRHIAAKLLIEPGTPVLDIGSGWGGLGLYLAEICGAHVTGITLSREQHAASAARAAERGLSGRVTFRLQDYREVTGRFERIVSVGMFEHVGVGHFDRFFATCAARLSPDGVMVLHAIGRSEPPGVTNPWVAKYIFPGGYIPSLSEVLPSIERAGLLVTDIEILRLHYADTLKAWRERFLARREEAERLYDARFVRMWEFYLASSEMSFRHMNMMVFQLQIAKRQGVVPVTRDYIMRTEQVLRRREAGAPPPLRIAGE